MSIARRPDRLVAILLSLALFVALPLTTASAQSAGDTADSNTYYLHSSSGDNTLDQAGGGATYDKTFPTSGTDEWATARDNPALQNTPTNESVDPTWRGSIDQAATSLSVNFWGRQTPDQDLFGTANYVVRVRPAGATTYYELLPRITDRPAPNGVVNIHQTFTTMKAATPATSPEVPLNLPAGALTFTIRGTFLDSDAYTEIRFDSTNYPSSFTVNGVGPTPTPDPTPTPADPNAFYLHSGTRVGQADRADGSSTFDGFEPTDTEPARFIDLPQVRNGAGEAIWDPYWTGSVETRFSSITLTFWQQQVDSLAGGNVSYRPAIFIGSRAYQLEAFTAQPSSDGSITHTFTHYVDANGAPLGPLTDLDPRGKAMTLTLPGSSTPGDAGATIIYDSVSTPSGFVIEPFEGPAPPAEPTECDGTVTQNKQAGEAGTYTRDPNDACFAKQWGMVKVQAPLAWEQPNATGHGITIAVIDSGLDLDHPDFDCPDKIDRTLAAAVIRGEVIRGDRAGDIDGHGTHVAGIVGACTNNGTGVVGVAPDATIVPYRVFTTAAEGTAPVEDIAVAIEAATNDGAHVINMSLGIGIGAVPLVGGVVGYLPGLVPEIDAAIEYAQSQGVVVVIAAGNSGVLPLCEYPAIAEDAICVGATDSRDLKAWYGTFPNKPDNEDPYGPSISAPGGIGDPGAVVGNPIVCEESIFSTFLRSAGSDCSDPGYEAIDGTSMASPHVAGAAALLYDRLAGDRSAANRELITEKLLSTAVDLGPLGYDPVFGEGRLDVLAAVNAVPTVVEPVEQPTTVTFTDTSADAAYFSDTATIAASLVDDENAPISGATLDFKLSGGTAENPYLEEWSVPTDSEGIASETRTLIASPGIYNLTVSYGGQTDVYKSDSDQQFFEVYKEVTVTTLNVESKGKSRMLIATLAEDDGPAVVNQEIVYFADGTEIGRATTNDKGIATLPAPKAYRSGSFTFRADFAGNDHYDGSSGSYQT